jgi:hypothetical protein
MVLAGGWHGAHTLAYKHSLMVIHKEQFRGGNYPHTPSHCAHMPAKTAAAAGSIVTLSAF